MKLFYPLFILLFFTQSVSGQSFPESLYRAYNSYKEQSIQKRRFTYSDIEPLIKQLSADPRFEVKQVGQSIEGHPINLVRIGNGETNVLFWSQMHGDESTATMALFDLFNFFRQNDDSFTEKKQQLLEEVSLYFIPMLNPDGAGRFTRRNAIGIDINRDARRTVTPEAKVLKTVRDSLEADFGFNLHDQSTYYTAGRSSKPATLSFLAPAYDFEQSENEVRSRAMRLIAYLNEILQPYIPGQVAKYSDAHEPRAFGDLIQKWGTSTILIESGGYPDDPEKQYIRKLNFVSMLAAIEAIARDLYIGTPVDNYYQIPENRLALTDLLIRKAVLVRENERYTIDINIRRSPRAYGDPEQTYYYSSVTDLGDLSTSHGYEELNAGGLEVWPGKIYPDTFQNIEEIKQLDMVEILKQGYTDVVVRETPDAPFLTEVPVNVVTAGEYTNYLALGSVPNLVLRGSDRVRYVIVNGFLYDVEEGNTDAIENTLVIE